MPLDARCEIVLDIDVACALVSAAENLANSGKLSGKKGFIAGGKENGCQLTNREMLGAVFEQIGLAFPYPSNAHRSSGREKVSILYSERNIGRCTLRRIERFI